jgi:hypothetical protein
MMRLEFVQSLVDGLLPLNAIAQTLGYTSQMRLEFVQSLVDGLLPLNAIAQTLGYTSHRSRAGVS